MLVEHLQEQPQALARSPRRLLVVRQVDAERTVGKRDQHTAVGDTGHVHVLFGDAQTHDVRLSDRLHVNRPEHVHKRREAFDGLEPFRYR